MTYEEKVLVEKYLACIEEEKKARECKNNALKELALCAPHKVGEIVKWTEKRVVRDGGTSFRPTYKTLPPEEKKAILACVRADVWTSFNPPRIRYGYEFKSVKKDGNISLQNCYPRNYEWTGEIHENYKKDI